MAQSDVPPPNLPPKPPSLPSDAEEETAPPRKRPRTHAPSRPAPAPAAEATPSAPSTSTNTASSPIHRFSIQPLDRFQGASASIKRPREVTHFSYDDNHEYREDDSSISYYHPPRLNTDLKEGFSTFHHYEETTNPHLDSLLRALASKERQTGEKVDVDFVTWRGMMTKIMTAPYDMFAEFSMFATRIDGTIYIEEDFDGRAAQRAAEKDRPPPRWQARNAPDHKMMTYWGYKFEVLSLLPTPPPDTPREVIDARIAAPVSNHAQHCSIVRTSFGPHSLLLGGEVDGLSGPKPPPTSDAPIPWIELKTSEELPPNPTHRDIIKFERKLLKFWAQSFLLGVPKVVVGWRSKMGILRGVQDIETGKIPGMVRRGTGCWDGNVCINFAAAFLGWLKENVGDDGVYRVELRKKAGVVEVQRVGDGTADIVTKEFTEWRTGMGGKDRKADAEVKDE
ncbi:RAI1-domain-containing protein [Massarina eburnea CBS 473.64]|uniref:Decapping nuclease n=1 Tax=Massarina eburnea CBS 473.64 TaxID=1395130 RepID=A0A6A6RTN9_9PLEO|nr:RAI1-domain-containing protein [Massarina eburnea CBS 473.64]